MSDKAEQQKYRNEKARAEFFRLVENEGIPVSDLEKRIVELFLSTENHLSINGIGEWLERNGEEAAPRDIEAMMELLVNLGFARKSRFEARGELLYEHRHLTEHHDHMVCIKCGRIIEFFVPELEHLQDDIASGFHFRPLNHKLDIYGICGDCMGRREPVMPLSMAAPGEIVELKEIRGGGEMKRRLEEMGLTPGVEMEVIAGASGQVIVSVKNSRVAIGRGMASRIFVGNGRK